MKNPFAKSKGKRLPDILATFTKTLQDLQNLVTNNGKSVEANTATIATLNKVNTELSTESQQAQSVITNINALLGKK